MHRSKRFRATEVTCSILQAADLFRDDHGIENDAQRSVRKDYPKRRCKPTALANLKTPESRFPLPKSLPRLLALSSRVGNRALNQDASLRRAQ